MRDRAAVRRRSESAHPGHRHRTPAMKGKEGGGDGDLMEKLRSISLSEKVARQQQQAAATGRSATSGNLASNYQLNYRPMPFGMRKRVWEEGMRYRQQRRKDGFNHFRLEWKSPRLEVVGTATGTGGGGGGGGGGHHRRQSSLSGDDADDEVGIDESILLESLDLPPTKLHKRHLRLLRRYASKQDLVQDDKQTNGKKEEEKRLVDANEEKDKPPARPLTSYERNKQNNMKSNIVLPTSNSSDDSTEESRLNGDSLENDGHRSESEERQEEEKKKKKKKAEEEEEKAAAATERPRMVEKETQVSSGRFEVVGRGRPPWKHPKTFVGSPRKQPPREMKRVF